ncbi:hypothetical protein D083_0340 [Dickeya solani RNS 08.23.3.1.A]|nr:hypothetical protein D083_0340 [Dickeya solani RNS 08.23.3.1.A]
MRRDKGDRYFYLSEENGVFLAKQRDESHISCKIMLYYNQD